jgi:hypothetical protein
MSSIRGKLEILGGLHVIDSSTEAEEEATSANELRIRGFKFVQEHVKDCRIDLCSSNHDVIHHRKPKFGLELMVKICYGIETESENRQPIDKQKFAGQSRLKHLTADRQAKVCRLMSIEKSAKSHAFFSSNSVKPCTHSK